MWRSCFTCPWCGQIINPQMYPDPYWKETRGQRPRRFDSLTCAHRYYEQQAASRAKRQGKIVREDPKYFIEGYAQAAMAYLTIVVPGGI